MSGQQDADVLIRLQREINRRCARGLYTREQLSGVGAIQLLLSELIARSNARAGWSRASDAYVQRYRCASEDGGHGREDR